MHGAVLESNSMDHAQTQPEASTGDDRMSLNVEARASWEGAVPAELSFWDDWIAHLRDAGVGHDPH